MYMIWENIFDATQSTTQILFDRTDFWLIRFAAMICSESTTMKIKNQMLLELIDLVACDELTLKCNVSFHIIHSYT